MSFFHRSPAELDTDEDPRIVSMADDEASQVLQALSSDTARSIWELLQEEPRTPSALAAATDTSVQNVHYHMTRLEEAGLIDEAGTAYSEKGREMSIYAPTASPLVLVSTEEGASELRDVLSKTLGALAGLALLSVLIQQLIPKPPAPSQTGGAYGTVPTATAPAIGFLMFIIGALLLTVWIFVRFW
jgi:DNA-binding transcriptional ArsR family regulator